MKKIILGTDDTHNLQPLQYPWAWNMVQKSLANTWFHTQTNMGRDKESFESLTAAERSTFLDVFATLTTSDIAVLHNVGASLMQHITAPEVEAYLARQIAEEGVHSITYQHVIEVLALDAPEIYRRYQTVPEIERKFYLANRYSEWIAAGPEVSLDKFLRGLMFYYGVFEGIWFYNGFSPIFSLQRRNLMPGTGTQLQYILRDESMHVAFGIKLIQTICAETGYRVPEGAVKALFEEAIQAEAYYAHSVIHPTLGYNAALHTQQAQYLTNRRLRQLGYSELLVGATNVLPWLDEQAHIKKEKNFFESHVTEYQTGALQWD